ncbi:hypothetical protein EJ06DRAFT_585829 [Trichodelitschia bisporula]|uniref:Uncharacterized protein n=1 Tax=Trichodelitschia bisporula TaxID=703511 RepID=A0A6G1HI53_9PEZI|nr:hypothetical protein EJ06DRAFT_585829 [Trichodelitschia bisporula]
MKLSRTPASEVRREYDERIEDFLKSVGVGSSRWRPTFSQQEPVLSQFIRWGEQTYRQNGLLEETTSKASNELTRCQKRNDELEERLRRMQQQLDDEIAKNERMAERNSAMVIEHSRSLQAQASEHKRRENKLLGQLMVNHEDSLGWADDVLRVRFLDLKRQLDELTSKSELRLEPHRRLGSRLDPNGFIERNGTDQAHFLLRSSIWRILKHQFFSQPFGFGVLGRGDGYSQLLSTFSSWQGLVSGNSAADSLDRLKHDRLANNWRMATFQYIHSIVTTERPDHGVIPVSRYYAANVESSITFIWDFLSGIVKLCNGKLWETAEREIRQIVRLVGEIALQFGMQSAHLELFEPKFKDEIKIGDDFEDCENKDMDRGMKFEVHLVTLPGLRKIGDGRTDMRTPRTIVACGIYPLREA